MALQYDGSPPPRVPPRVKSAPKIRQIYWCNLPVDAELPELWKVRPAVIISYRHTLYGHVTVAPTTTIEQPDNKWAYKLTTSLDGRNASWVICDKPMTLAVSRLEPRRSIPRITESELREILARLFDWLPKM